MMDVFMARRDDAGEPTYVVYDLAFQDPIGGYDRIVRGDNRTVYSRGAEAHREDGPAVFMGDFFNRCSWHIDGLLHREDGPALHEEYLAPHTVKDRYIARARSSTGVGRWMAVDVWARRGVIHRDGGPAITWKDGTQEWWRGGVRYREDLPAVMCADGALEWHGRPSSEQPPKLETGFRMAHHSFGSRGNRYWRETGPTVITGEGIRIWGTGETVCDTAWTRPPTGPWIEYPQGDMRFGEDPDVLYEKDHPRVLDVRRRGRAYVESLFEAASLSLDALLQDAPDSNVGMQWREMSLENRVELADRALWAIHAGQGNLPVEEERKLDRWAHEYERTIEEEQEQIRLWREDMKGYLRVALRRVSMLSAGERSSLDEALRATGLPVEGVASREERESRLLMLTVTVPAIDIAVPETIGLKDVVNPALARKPRPLRTRTALYINGVAEIALAVLAVTDAVSSAGSDTVLLNVMVDDIDKATGLPERYCTLSIRTNWEKFRELKLDEVDPVSCVRHLAAAVPRPAKELAPVRPIVEFDKNDARFVQAQQVASELDTRANLMDLTPLEFEALIQNLFERIGLDTQQTQASRDGGVDCIAYDPRPVFGGKIVIQAKRYKNTVGVSAVRDLYGTMLNEGAMKGLLVTTSGYGKASFDFANNKPIELLDGAHLLHMLKEHLEIEAIIVPPDDWRDAEVD